MDDAELNEPPIRRASFDELVRADEDYRFAINRHNSARPGASRAPVVRALRRLMEVEERYRAMLEHLLSREESEAGT